VVGYAIAQVLAFACQRPHKSLPHGNYSERHDGRPRNFLSREKERNASLDLFSTVSHKDQYFCLSFEHLALTFSPGKVSRKRVFVALADHSGRVDWAGSGSQISLSKKREIRPRLAREDKLAHTHFTRVHSQGYQRNNL